MFIIDNIKNGFGTVKNVLEKVPKPVKWAGGLTATVVAWSALDHLINSLTSGEARMARAIKRKYVGEFKEWCANNPNKPTESVQAKKYELEQKAIAEINRNKNRNQFIKDATESYYDKLQSSIPE